MSGWYYDNGVNLIYGYIIFQDPKPAMKTCQHQSAFDLQCTNDFEPCIYTDIYSLVPFLTICAIIDSKTSILLLCML